MKKRHSHNPQVTKPSSTHKAEPHDTQRHVKHTMFCRAQAIISGTDVMAQRVCIGIIWPDQWQQRREGYIEIKSSDRFEERGKQERIL